MFSKIKLRLISKINFYYLFLFIFSISINQYYGYIGVFPLDSFLVFNSGYDVLNGYYPFKDYWAIKGVLLDSIQALFFKIFGVSWFSYVLHASFFNFIITISTYLILVKFKLSENLSFFYSLLVAVLAYPSAGTPFSDHHVTILSLICVYLFIAAVKTNSNKYWLFLPIVMGLAFLSKQAPSAYFILIIAFFSLIYFSFYFDVKKIFYGFVGVISIFTLFIFFLNLAEIRFINFIEQYILFPQSLGKTRLEWVFPLEFKRVVLRFKLIYLSLVPLFYILFQNKFKIFRNSKKFDLLIILTLIISSLILIFHQLMTINAKYIFFIIPIMAGFSHAYSNIYLNKKKVINIYLILLTLSSTIYYHETYIAKRRFMDLEKVNLANSIDGKEVHEKFSNIKWITYFYPNNPKQEARNLVNAFEIVKRDKRKKMLITDYQYISVFLNIYDSSISRFWYHHHGYPSLQNKYFEMWKEFFIDKLQTNNIEVIYLIKPLYGDQKPFENILNEECLIKSEPSRIIDTYDISKCFK